MASLCLHTVNTHPEQWAAIYAAAPGEQLGFRCLAQGHLSRGIEGGESAVHSLPPPNYNPCRPETRTRNLSITSPTLSIRPRLPQKVAACLDSKAAQLVLKQSCKMTLVQSRNMTIISSFRWQEWQ